MILDEIKNELAARLEETREWLLITKTGKSFALTNDEFELIAERGKLLFSFQSDKGFQTFRVVDYKLENGKINLDLSKNFGAEKTKIQLVPRILTAEFSIAVELARTEKANKIAHLIIENESRSKLLRVSLKHENSCLAQIVFENNQGRQTIVFNDVSDTLSPEKILTAAIFEFEKLSRRKKNSVENLRILAEKKIARSLQKTAALLKQNWQEKIAIYEISTDKKKQQILELLPHLEIPDLWRGKSAKVSTFGDSNLSETARKIIAFAPEQIDAVFTKHGETLRFCGLPFARVRRIAGEEKAWFGIESKRQILSKESFAEFLKLIGNLKIYRRFDSPNKRHILHMLALRKDGRLVIVELKTSVDREMIFQSADYWRKIEFERRAGNLQTAKIFGDLKIRNESALIYLVAPLLAFHRDFDFLAQTIAPEIEIYRFDLNENWRENLQVIRQNKTF